MSLEYSTRSKSKDQKKKRVSPLKNFNVKDIEQTIKLLGIGISLGSGVLGAAYLSSVGISPIVSFVFGAGVLMVHINYIRIITKNVVK
jgi:arginine repressor